MADVPVFILKNRDADEPAVTTTNCQPGSPVGWTVFLWVFVLIIIPATLIPIINYATTDMNISTTAFALEIVLLAVATIIFFVALFKVFWTKCD